jgi:hypothetical protein
MKFCDKDFLLSNGVARELYHGTASRQPIIDYHCHLSPKDLADDRRFENVHEPWLGGVYLNVGSAVVLPEVFLKAVSAVRNLGHPLAAFTTANFDFLQHYRPLANVVHRPHAGGAGGHGYAITGHHELMIPLLAAALIERDS